MTDLKAPPFMLGVNYWPRNKAMYWWKDFNASEVASEFAEIAQLRLHVVRLFLFWEDFQPSPDTINDQALRNLSTVLDLATEARLMVMPTFFTGHMSGINWWPTWALSDTEDPAGNLRIAGGEFTARTGRDLYTDPFMLTAEQLLVTAVCSRFGAHPAIYAWNFANEPDLFCLPKTFADGAAWNALMYATARKYTEAPISTGIHLFALDRYAGFRPDLLAPANDYLSMHAYSIYYRLTEQTDPMNSDVVPVACLATEGLGGKRVLFEEFGYASSVDGIWSGHKEVRRGPETGLQYFAGDAAGGAYYTDVLAKLVRCGALGAFAWMFSDYTEKLWLKPPFDSHEHERFFGLTRGDGSVKPSGEAMRQCAIDTATMVPARSVGPLALDADAWYHSPTEHFDGLFRELAGTL